MPENPRQSSAATTWGREREQYLQDPQPVGLWRQPRRRPRHLRPAARGLTSSGGSVSLLALQGGLRAVRSGGGRRREAARSRRLHLMEKRGESLDLGVRCKRGEERDRRPCWKPSRPGGGARGTGSLDSRWRQQPYRDSRKPATWKTARILVFCTSRLAPGLLCPPCKPVGCQQVASSPAFLRQAWSPEAESISPQPPPQASGAKCWVL